ncbi:bifunctional tetrahydrofolate synthase/dihydrofolate synthase [Neptunomonas qingdaonensis]|uniref:Dihydrofolate synthase/folylpolyglutamate synthase n=1 Tax=Neptunomonas qingdaonensis TaxID=1045558 RepID=A0A1I2V302_9GAMM|nr:bifunctional tetrahydrofolate synthase/dihydrofolate synthase [Neptunomonas qingdaonensis]SFG81596.1 dihydrofolate synthase / folylpolyglutamate synthase [Neptunomonas qingdaonensis]
MNRSEFTLEQWLGWMEKNHPVAIDLGLGRVQQVFTRLDLDFRQVCVITVAGTNGKGSTVSMLDAIYRQAGYKTACYTSPHLQIYNERVRLNGGLVTDQQLVSAFSAVDQACGDISLTYFEMGTLAALWLIAEQQPDVAILEVGLGGRLDAINVLDADVAVITTIDIDHVDWLGDDREKIGWEKAGIFRKEKPAVCGELKPPASIAEYARELGCELRQVNQSYEYHIKNDRRWSWEGRDLQGNIVSFSDLPLPQLPVQNAATAIQAVLLSGLLCSPESMAAGLQTAYVAGRMEQVAYQGRLFILDVAHNPQSAAYLADQLKQAEADGVVLILGMLADKDCASVMQSLAAVVTSWHLVTLDVPRGQTAEQLRAYLPQMNQASVMCHASVDAAISHLILADLPTSKKIVVAGSFYTVGDAYRVLKREVD